MLSYGLSYSSSLWVWQLRTLINPIIVGRFAGPTAVGNVALAIRMTEVLSFAKGATWRVAMTALAKLGESRDRLRRSIDEGMRLQTIAVGLPMAAFSLLAPFILPSIFGHRWDLALRVFPFIALDYLCNSVFNLHSSVLYLLRRNMQVTCFHLVHVAMFLASSMILVPTFGATGYGMSAVLAIGSYAVMHHMITKAVGSPNYKSAALWLAIAVVNVVAGATASRWRFGVALLFAIPLLIPSERSHIAGYGRLLMAKETV
jgi:PST family polysaccharide transporter